MPGHDAARCAACVRCEAAIDDIAARTGYPRDTVAWIHGAVSFVGTWRRKGATTHHVDAAEFCRMLVADLPARTAQQARVALEAMGLPASRDIGRIVYARVDAGLCVPDEGDSEEHFAAIYTPATIEAHAARVIAARPRDLPVRARQLLVCVLGIVGALFFARQSFVPANAAVGGALLGAAWWLSRWSRPTPMRFGLPWSTLHRVPRADVHDA
ncbi:MAG: hypothetical protein ACTHK2_06950 [Dokdonella sp.]|uniref:hypothetical protein n=1 Tax=Dokdonella sp. TaxID=2291710 RepID=UPI003F7F662E